MAEATANGLGQHTLHGAQAHDPAATGIAPAEVHQEHPIKLYLVVWVWLFILSACSYLVDYFHVAGYLRWSLILIFMALKAGLIVAVFMHMAWERLALSYAILVPPLVLLVFVGIMVFESNYTLFTRLAFFVAG
jgi:cytochrome c oxidase subunit 4